MDIQQAKQQIKYAMQAYLAKDEFGRYRIPIARQRPILLMGPPGVGKTEIMAQIASELNIALLSYSMTHHTRQSALGLPLIAQKKYGENDYSVSEYTMSEIIASVYDLMEETEKKEGILFLDEINCVSETLMPIMLQFLQYKVFGRHRVPAGWIIVAAGNPPEYNASARDFDVAIQDRVRRIDVKPDYEVWRKYAATSGVHPVVISYLDGREEHLYRVRSTVDGKQFVTMRGWTDLSEIITLHEQQGLPVDESLVRQFVQDVEIAKDFAIYYDLFQKYKGEYQISKILDGTAEPELATRMTNASMDERLVIVSLLSSTLKEHCRAGVMAGLAYEEVLGSMDALSDAMLAQSSDATEAVTAIVTQKQKKLALQKRASALSCDLEQTMLQEITLYERLREELRRGNVSDLKEIVATTKKLLENVEKEVQATAAKVKKELDSAFLFAEKAFSKGYEMLLFVTDLTENWWTSQFIARFGCEKYFQYNSELMFYERNKSLINKVGKSVAARPKK